MTDVLRHFHLFMGVGGAAKGGHHVDVSTGDLTGRLVCCGGVDVDQELVDAFTRYVGARGTRLDLFDRSQYEAYHGQAPPPGWREATPDDLRQAADGVTPDIVVSSPPCQGASGLISEAQASTAKYTALNGLTLRGIALALQAWADDPPGFWLLENVPRLASRGRHLLDQILVMLEEAGYCATWTIPDLGEIGALAQTRKRLHLVARHREKVPVHVFEPPRRPLRAVGEVLGDLPLPGDLVAGPLHELPRLWWRTWLRLALIPAGGDWRHLRDLAVVEGVLRDYGIAPGTYWHPGVLGVTPWTAPAATITGRGGATNGAHALADPRIDGHPRSVQYGVRSWWKHAPTVKCDMNPGQGPYTITDPRLAGVRHNNVFRIVRFDDPAVAVTAGQTPTSGGVSVADPRLGCSPRRGSYGVVGWQDPAPTVADPRQPIPTDRDRGIYVIQALDGTWHRPMTTLERAALQGLVDLGTMVEFTRAVGDASKSTVSKWIGNAIPPPAMRESLRAAGVAILLSRAGETFALSNAPVWVRPVARAVLSGIEGG